MRIMLLTGSLILGGAERQVINLANELADRGHEVTMTVVRPLGLEAARPLFNRNVNIICLDRKRKYDFWFLAKFLRVLKRQQPQILHSYLAPANIVSALARPFYRGQIVWSIRSARTKPDKRDPMGHWRMFLSRTLDSFADFFISNSHAGKAIRVQMGVRAERIAVVPNGIDVSEFRIQVGEGQLLRKSLGIGPDHTLVGIVAAIRPVKDHSTFLKMAAYLVDRDPNYRFVVAGRGDENYVNSLKKLAEELGLGKRVMWLGRRSDVRAIYNGIDVLVSSSLAEGFSNVVAEAMACGTPVVVTDAGASREIVVHEELVSNPGDWESLAKSVQWAVGAMKSGLLTPAGIRETILQRYDLRFLAPRTERIFEQLIEVKSRKRHPISDEY